MTIERNEQEFIDAWGYIEDVPGPTLASPKVNRTFGHVHSCDRNCSCPFHAKELWRQHKQVIVYGVGGWNRYFIDADGRITISKAHVVEGTNALEKAAERNIPAR